MGAVLVRVGAELRSRWRAWLVVALMLGLFGGAVIAIAAGARRTDSAYPRLLRATNATDVVVYDFTDEPGFAELDFQEVAKLPQVLDHVLVTLNGNDELFVTASTDPRYGTSFQALKILEGRMPRMDAADEVSVAFITAERFGYDVGDVIDTQLSAGFELPPFPVRLRVVGIHAAAGEFPPIADETAPVFATPAFLARHAKDHDPEGILIRLRRGAADVPAFNERLRAMGGGKIAFAFAQSEHADNVKRSFRLQALALWLLAAFLAVGIILVLGQTLARQNLLEGDEYPALRSLGMTHGQLTAVGVLRALSIAGVAAVVAAVVTVLASPLFPSGDARRAEPTPGLAVDATVLALGSTAILILVVALAAPSARRAARQAGDALGLASLEKHGVKPSFADRLARAGMPAPTVTGVRLALEPGRGRSAVPVRTVLLGVTLGVAVLAAALAFQASLSGLLTSPEDYGLRWDALVTEDFGTDARTHASKLEANPMIGSFAAGSIGVPLDIGDHRVEAIAVVDVESSGLAKILEGREPHGDDEIVLGTRTLDSIGKRVGDRIDVAVSGTDAPAFRIVGRGVTPPIGDSGSFGEGAVLDYSALVRIVDDPATVEEEAPPPDQLFIRFAPGVSPAAGLARLNKDFGAGPVDAPAGPLDLVNFGRVKNLPLILAGLLALLASATLVHALVTAITRRRRDLAILKTLGFVRRQVKASVAWQATTLAGVAIAIGVPIGIVLGRALWTVLANDIGVVPSPRSGLAPNLLLIPLGIALANVIALIPARSASRTQPAVVLRTE